VLKGVDKYDLDNPEGQASTKKNLKCLERLLLAFKCKTASRDYRNAFSKAYKILYN